MAAPGAKDGETAAKKGRKTRRQETQQAGTGSTQRPNGRGDNFMELLDAVARHSLNSQHQTRKLCATVWNNSQHAGKAHRSTTLHGLWVTMEMLFSLSA